MSDIVNRVDQSGIITLNLGDYYPETPIACIDIKDWLFKGLILKEKDFRETVKAHNWSQYDGKAVCIFCSADAIIPVWAWMIIQSSLAGHARITLAGTEEDMLFHLFQKNLQQAVRPEAFKDKPVVIKGCGDKPTPAGIFMEAVKLLVPHVRSIMYGEPCSTVPVYKKTTAQRIRKTSDKARK